jgi:predicted permease
MFLRIFTIVAPLILVVLVGYCYGRFRRPEMGIANQINMDVFIPALIFHVLSQEDFFPSEYLWLALGGVGVILGSGMLAFMLARLMGYQWKTMVPPLMFSNWGNLGLPLFVFSFGDQALNAGVIMFITGNILHFTLGRGILSGHLNLFYILRSPILLAVIIGLFVNTLSLNIPYVLAEPIEMIGQIAIPLMLFSLGVRLTRVGWGDCRIGLVSAVACPVFGVSIALLLSNLLPLDGLQAKQLILFGVLPPAVLNFVLAEQYGQEPEKVASIVMVANMASIISIPVLLFFLLE